MPGNGDVRSQGESAVMILEGRDLWTVEHCDGAPRWIAWGDLDLFHRIRDLAGLPHRGPRTQRLVLDALGHYAARPGSRLKVVGYDRGTRGRYFGLNPAKQVGEVK